MFEPDFEKIAGQAIARARNYGPEVEHSAKEAVMRAKNLFTLSPDEVEMRFQEQMERFEKEGMI